MVAQSTLTERVTVPLEPALRVPPSVQVTVPVPPTAGAVTVQEVIPGGKGPHVADWKVVYTGTGSVIITFCSKVVALGFP
jgi:hypothetical protein